MKKSRFEVLSDIWDTIDSPNMEFFNNRLLLQKKVYLLKELGLDLDYNFHLYLHGPYSKDLATDGYKISTIKNSSDKKVFVIDSAILTKLKELEKGHNNDILWFELLATITYLKNVEKKDKEEIKKFISDNKPYIFNLFEEGYKILINEKLITN